MSSRLLRHAAAALGLTGSLTLAVVGTATTSLPAGGRSAGTFLPAPTPPALMPHASVGNLAVRASINWSGYAQRGKKGTFMGVEASWTVPTVSTSPPGSQYSSDWVGVGGFSDRTLVQAGTLGDNVGGTAEYQAWTEILPAAEVPLSMVVNPGDSITTVVQETSPDVWLMQVADNSTSVTQSRTVSYKSSGRSVEAIHEATTVCSPRCTVGTLATTTNATFDPGFYTSALQPTFQPILTPAITKERVTKKGTILKFATMFELVMTDKTGATIATPSAPDSDSDGFTVADGSAMPGPPSS